MSNRKHIQIQKMKRPTRLVGFLECQFIEATVCGQICRSTLKHYSDSDPTSLCSYSLMLHSYQFYSLWFDKTGAKTHGSTTFKVSMLIITQHFCDHVQITLKREQFFKTLIKLGICVEVSQCSQHDQAYIKINPQISFQSDLN